MTRASARHGVALLVAAAALGAAAGATGGCGGPARSGPAPQAGERVTRLQATAGVSVALPRGWQLTKPPITALTVPAERLLLTSYPARRGGNCAPDRAERALPSDGALVFLFEYRPSPPGDPWRDLRRADFPPRPAHFALRARDVGRFECWRVASHLIRFRADGRPFQMHVALGADVSAARRAQLLRVLDSLRFATTRRSAGQPATRTPASASTAAMSQRLYDPLATRRSADDRMSTRVRHTAQVRPGSWR
jgi:hypothetical protein